MKAQPAIDAVEHIISSFAKGGARRAEDLKKKKKVNFKIILPSPSKKTFTQKTAHSLNNTQHIIFVCTRYEGIDYRFEQYMQKKYKKSFQKISL